MSVYLDPSVLVSFFVSDALTPRADRFFRNVAGPLLVSDFAGAEFASAVSRLVRMGRMDRAVASGVLDDFDDWKARATDLTDATGRDIATAAIYLRRLDLNLRTADAIHVAICQRLRVALATFDERMAESARTLGVDLAAA